MDSPSKGPVMQGPVQLWLPMPDDIFTRIFLYKNAFFISNLTEVLSPAIKIKSAVV